MINKSVPARVAVGDKAQMSRLVTGRDIELFSEITGDRNPLHFDAETAARTRFGGIIVQGGITSGLLNAVVGEKLPGPGSVFLHVDWSFRAAVSPGDRYAFPNTDRDFHGFSELITGPSGYISEIDQEPAVRILARGPSFSER